MFMQDISRSSVAFQLVETLLAPVTTGLVAGTLVETADGWVPIEALRIGEAVHTLDGGLARILGLDRRCQRPEVETAPLLIPGGILDACSDMLVLPGQHVLLDTLQDDALGGAPFVLLPAIALAALPGVLRPRLQAEVEIVTPLFADEEIVYGNSGVLLHCPGIIDGAGRYPENSFFPRLDASGACRFLARRSARLAA